MWRGTSCKYQTTSELSRLRWLFYHFDGLFTARKDRGTFLFLARIGLNVRMMPQLECSSNLNGKKFLFGSCNDTLEDCARNRVVL